MSEYIGIIFPTEAKANEGSLVLKDLHAEGKQLRDLSFYLLYRSSHRPRTNHFVGAGEQLGS